MKLVFFNTPKTEEAKLLLTKKALAKLTASLVKLLKVELGHHLNIAFDATAETIFSATGPVGMPMCQR
ncbi:MAG: hypothetical protein ACRYFX_18085 [Janthinobacterium lividum]